MIRSPYGEGSLGILKPLWEAEENGVDFRYFELPHSGHGLQNDHALYRQWMETVEEYLDKYMPVE